jgi:tetratricopeptide (TPR) repeat protein
MPIWSSEIKEIERLYESLKGQLPDLEKELERLIKTDDENIVLVYSRRCLEVIITDLCETELNRPRKTEPLKGIIDKLAHEEKVPSHISASMDGLNSLSAFGAHPKDFDPEQVKPVLNNLATIIRWYQKYKDSKSTCMSDTGADIITVAQTRVDHPVGKVTTGADQTFIKIKTEGDKDMIISRDVPKGIFRKSKVSLILLLSGILVVAAIIAYPKIFRQDKLEKLRSSGERISVAVMPFQNRTNDTIWNVWQEGIQEHLTNSLSNSEELKVRQTESIRSLIQSKNLTNYASITPSFASTISQKLDANVFVYGNIIQAGNKIRVGAQLIDTKTEEVFKSFQIEGSSEEENIFQVIDSLSDRVKNFLLISKLDKRTRSDLRTFVSTSSPEAYRYFIYGNTAFYKREYPTAIDWFLQAIKIDSNFIGAIARLTYSYGNSGLYDEAKKWCLNAYGKKNLMSVQQRIYIDILYATYFGTPDEALMFARRLLELDDQMPTFYYMIGYRYNILYQYDKAIPEFEKELDLYNKWGLKPMWINDYTNLGLAYHKTGQYKKERKLYKKAEQDFPGDWDLVLRQAILALTEGDTNAANEYIEKIISKCKDYSVTEANLSVVLGWVYSEAGIPDKAEEYYRKALYLEPENPDMMHKLAWFLINKDRNINEGLELINKELKLKPEEYLTLDAKGWGLYKLGKTEEALEYIQKAWDLKPIYRHEIFLHLEEVKKAVAGQKTD